MQLPRTHTDVPPQSAGDQVIQDQLRQLQLALASHVDERGFLELVDQVQAGIFRVSAEGTLTLANNALSRMFGLTGRESIPDPKGLSANAATDVSALTRLAQEVERDGEVRNRENAYQSHDGSLIHVRESARAVRDDAGRVLYYEGVIEDITPLRRSQSLGRDNHHILKSLAIQRPVDEILAEIAEMAARQFAGSASLILRWHARDAIVVAHSNVACGLPDKWSGRNAQIFRDPACNGSGVMCRRLPPYHPFASHYSNVWSVSLLASDGTPLGCLAVLNRSFRTPGPEEHLSLKTAAQLASLALEQNRLQRDLHQLANYDSLTQLPNRALLKQRLDEAIQQARIHGHAVGLLHVDLDYFKVINDQLGPTGGDCILREIGERLTAQAGEFGFVARLGGDEFAIALPKITNQSDATRYASGVLALLAQCSCSPGERLPVTASIGISVYPFPACDAASLQCQADSAAFIAKTHGRNTVHVYEPAQFALIRNRVGLELALRQGLARDEFALYYQPQVDSDLKVCGIEALLRWKHPREGMLAPDHFLPLAEQSGLIVPIGEWVIQRAARQIAEWRHLALGTVPVSVNVSALQLQGECLPELVTRSLHNFGVPPQALAIEITESLVMRNSEHATAQLQALRQLGIKVAIDDFGTGYSSLSYLQHLPADSLKIDRSFVRSLGTRDDKANAVVRAIVALARTFQLKVTAEGVETQAQFAELRDLGVETYQGFLFGRPMSGEQVTKLLGNRERCLL